MRPELASIGGSFGATWKPALKRLVPSGRKWIKEGFSLIEIKTAENECTTFPGWPMFPTHGAYSGTEFLAAPTCPRPLSFCVWKQVSGLPWTGKWDLFHLLNVSEPPLAHLWNGDFTWVFAKLNWWFCVRTVTSIKGLNKSPSPHGFLTGFPASVTLLTTTHWHQKGFYNLCDSPAPPPVRNSLVE